ncbi:uncharacterized protein isoform X1 [Danio rerio]|uniref:Uncharacterized protein isoform X1 n=3 Tax=Danio rerio TaxID=7955 RepID=A0AB32TM09_DANRE
MKNNAATKVGHIRAFLRFMSAGSKQVDDMTFLENPARIREWVVDLGRAPIVESTRSQYLKHVIQFLQYVHEAPPTCCRLTPRAMVVILRELRCLSRGLRRKVAAHERCVKRSKEARLIRRCDLWRCHQQAGSVIPKLLGELVTVAALMAMGILSRLTCDLVWFVRADELSSSPNTRHQWRLYGYLIAYLVSITGHRPGVFQNLLIQEVVSARRSSDGLSFVINAETHKTNQTYGAAQLAVTSEEYEWFNRFLEVRSSLPGGNAARYFFFTSRPASCKNLNQYFQIAWAEMKLPGCPTFTDVRSSIATHIKHAHTGDLRAKLSDFMAHDTGTSDRYYAMNLTASQAMSYRHWFEQALCASPGDNQTDGRPPSEKKVAKRSSQASRLSSNSKRRKLLQFPPLNKIE